MKIYTIKCGQYQCPEYYEWYEGYYLNKDKAEHEMLIMKESQPEYDWNIICLDVNEDKL